MKRRVIGFIFTLVLLLTLSAATLWARASWATDEFTASVFWRGERFAFANVTLRSHADVFVLTWDRRSFSWEELARGPADRSTAPRGLHLRHEAYTRSVAYRPQPDSNSPWWYRMGFGYQPTNPQIALAWAAERKLTAPKWFPFMCGAMLSAAIALRALWTRRQRESLRRRGLCPACGYDLRGAAHDRCPECGEAVAVAAV